MCILSNRIKLIISIKLLFCSIGATLIFILCNQCTMNFSVLINCMILFVCIVLMMIFTYWVIHYFLLIYRELYIINNDNINDNNSDLISLTNSDFYTVVL